MKRLLFPLKSFLWIPFLAIGVWGCQDETSDEFEQMAIESPQDIEAPLVTYESGNAIEDQYIVLFKEDAFDNQELQIF